MGRRVVAGVLAVVLAAAGTAVLVMYVRGAEQRALAGQESVDVLVVSERIEEGTPVDEIGDMVDPQPVPASVRAEGSIDDLGALDGQVAAVDLMPGEQVVANRFVDPATFEAASRVDLPEGLQIVSVELSPERAVGGQINPGDTVGMIFSFGDSADEPEDDAGPESSDNDGPTTHFVLHKVLVTNVQGSSVPKNEEDDTRDGKPDDSQMISLAVEATDAERVVFAAENGSIWLTNEPEDATEDGTRVQRLDRIYE